MPKLNAISDVDPVAITLCKQGANRKRIFLRKEMSEKDLTLTLPARTHDLIRKADGGDWSVFYCVVAEPGAEEDCGLVGDQITPDVWASEEEIRKAAHAFARNDGYVNLAHDALAEEGCTVVENAVALNDFDVVDPQGVAQTIKKGSWYIAVEPNEQAKKLVEAGEIQGVSMEGTGIRTLIEKANQPNSNTCPDCGATVKKGVATCPNCGAKMPQKSAVKKSLLDKIRDLLATEERGEIRKQQTFADIVAENTIQDSLYDGFDALRMSIWNAFDADAEGTGDKEDLITQSVNEFRDWLVGLVNAQPDSDAEAGSPTAVRKQLGNLRVIETPEEDREAMDAAQFEEFKKSQSDAFDRLAGLVEGLVETITKRTDPKTSEAKGGSGSGSGDEQTNPEDLKKAISEVGEVVGDRLDQLEASVDKLAASGSQQNGDTSIQKSGEKKWYAGILD